MKRAALTLAALVGLLSVARADPLTLGLVAQYQFDGNLTDSSGNGLNLTAGGTFNYVSDHLGHASSAVQLVTANPANGTFFLGTGPDLANRSSSVSFWVKKNYIGNGSNGSWVFGLGHPAGIGGSAGEDMNVSLDYGQSLRYSFFYDDFNSNTSLPNNQWVNLAFTFDYGSSLRSMYINGVLDSINTASAPFTGGNSLKVGFEGISLDDLRFYDRALSAKEIKRLNKVPEGGMTALYALVGMMGIAAMRRVRRVGV